MESSETTLRDKVSLSSDKKNKAVKKRGFSSRLNKAVKSSLNKRATASKLKTNIIQESSKSPAYQNQALMNIVSRNDHLQNKGAYNTVRTGYSNKRNHMISAGQSRVKMLSRNARNTSMGSTTKNRPQTAINIYSEGIENNAAQDNLKSPPDINDRFQSQIGPFAQDIRGVGGSTSTDAWNKGFFLSTSIEGALHNHNNFSKSGGQVKRTPQSNTISYSNNFNENQRNLGNQSSYNFPDVPHASLKQRCNNEYSNQNELFGKIINPCIIHNQQEIIYLDKTERRGLCKDCIAAAQDNHHEILSILDAKEDAINLLIQLESNTMNMYSQEKELLQVNKQKFNVIENDRKHFISEQQNKINELHNYLDEKLRCIIAEYNKAIEPDITNVKNTLYRLEEKAQEHKIFVLEIQNLLEVFKKRVVPSFVDNISKCANMLNYYNHLKTLNSVDCYTTVYPNHRQDIHPVF